MLFDDYGPSSEDRGIDYQKKSTTLTEKSDPVNKFKANKIPWCSIGTKIKKVGYLEVRDYGIDESTWQSKMVKIGGMIKKFLTIEILNKSSENMIKNITSHLKEQNAFSDESRCLFDELLMDMMNIGFDPNTDRNGRLPKNQSKDQLRRNFLSAIVALQWYFLALKNSFYPELGGIRGATAIHDQELISKFYLKYLAFEYNVCSIDFSISIYPIYDYLSHVIPSPIKKKASQFAYLRPGVFSSHLKQENLRDIVQFGIDMRFMKNLSCSAILPNKGRHLLLSFFRFRNSSKVVTFYKEESYGFGSLPDRVGHLNRFAFHLVSKKAKLGPRETATPKEETSTLMIELEANGFRASEKLINRIKNANSKKMAVNGILEDIASELNEHKNATILLPVFRRIFPIPEVIGKEYKILPWMDMNKSFSGYLIIDPCTIKI